MSKHTGVVRIVIDGPECGKVASALRAFMDCVRDEAAQDSAGGPMPTQSVTALQQLTAIADKIERFKAGIDCSFGARLTVADALGVDSRDMEDSILDLPPELWWFGGRILGSCAANAREIGDEALTRTMESLSQRISRLGNWSCIFRGWGTRPESQLA